MVSRWVDGKAEFDIIRQAYFGRDGFGYRKSTADQNNGRVSVGIKVDELSVG